MGGGSWDREKFVDYTINTKHTSVMRDGSIDFRPNTSYQEVFRKLHLENELNPKNVIRECCDSDEHPNTIPVIIGLDVSGSMGPAAVEVAKQLNVIMTELYESHKDIEFMIMGIGDLAYDEAPIQVSQFESDIRIAEQLDKIYFEGGGGGNGYESYTSAWFFGSRCCKLDCWNRGKKGIIITIGDECINPYLPSFKLKNCIGNTASIQANIETSYIYEEASKKFDIFHIHVNHDLSSKVTANHVLSTWRTVIGYNNAIDADLKGLAQQIVSFINISICSQGLEVDKESSEVTEDPTVVENNNSITWDTTPSDPDAEPSISESVMNNCITW